MHVVYGINAVMSALDSGRPIEKILVSKSLRSGRIAQLLSAAKAKKITLQFVPLEALNRKAPDAKHQGIIAMVSAVPVLELSELLQKCSNLDQNHTLVILDGIEDPHNLGAIARSAEAAGVAGLIVAKHRSAPLSPVVSKASTGAIEYLPIARVGNLAKAMQKLKQAGYWIVGSDEGGRDVFWDFKFKMPAVIVIGSEGQGMRRLVKDHCDDLVRIPMFGKMTSLNASVAAGLLFYEFRRSMHEATKTG